MRDASVRDHDIDPAQGRDHFGRSRLDRIEIRHVERHRMKRAGAARFEFGEHGIELRLPTGSDADVGTRLGEIDGEGPADAARTTSNEDAFVPIPAHAD